MPFFIYMKNKNFQPIQEIGFSSLIDKISEYDGKENKDIINGIGDDASVLSIDATRALCTTTEIFLEGVHFDLTYHPLQHLGYKIVTAAVSDIYAMNCVPDQILTSIAIPNKYSVQMIEQLYQGVDAACKDYNCQLTGGDTTASHQILAVSVTATGIAQKDKIIYRNTAAIDDAICVTGDLGGALAGLRILMREKEHWKNSDNQQFQPDLQEYEYVVKRQLLPSARLDFVKDISQSEIVPTAMLDLTQGLLADCKQLAVKSGNGAELFTPAVPISLDTRKVADEMKEDVDKYAFYGGEDFEMLFTLNKDHVEKFAEIFDDFVVIGRMTQDKNKFIINTGEGESIEIDL